MKIFIVIASALFLFGNGASARDMTRGRDLQGNGFEGVGAEMNKGGGGCDDCCKLTEIAGALASSALLSCGAGNLGPSDCQTRLCEAHKAIFVSFAFAGGKRDTDDMTMSPLIVPLAGSCGALAPAPLPPVRAQIIGLHCPLD